MPFVKLWSKDKLKAIYNFTILGNVLEPVECIVCRSNKTNGSLSGYEKLIKCKTQAGEESLALFVSLPSIIMWKLNWYYCTRILVLQISPTLYQPYRKRVSRAFSTWRMFSRVGSICEENCCPGEEIEDYIQFGSKVKRTPNNKNNWNQRNTSQRRKEKA